MKSDLKMERHSPFSSRKDENVEGMAILSSESWFAGDLFWLGVGLGGQLLFTLRVVTQWWISERNGRCIVPTVYWVFGLCGGLCLLAYGWYRRDPVILLGQFFGSFVSCRNLMLTQRIPNEEEPSNRKSLSGRSLWSRRPIPALKPGSSAS